MLPKARQPAPHDVSLRAVPPDSAANSPLYARYVPWLAGSIPLAYYVAHTRSDGGFFEEGSFVAAARDFTVSHPPGAPVQNLLGSALALVPVGPLAFRVGLVSALCAALLLALFARSLLATLKHIGVDDARLSAPLSLAAALWLAQTPLFFEQATRPHVFALQFALSMLIVYTLLRFEAEEPQGTTRVLYFGAFLQGLCFANHHVYGLLMLPLAAPTLGRVFARRGFMGIMGHLAAPIVGFSVYVFVPLRLGRLPDSAFADENSLKRMLSWLGAEPYAGPSWAPEVPLLSTLRSGLGLQGFWPLSGAAVCVALGLWVSLRSTHRRRFGTLWFLAAVIPALSVMFTLHPRLVPDAWGALVPCAAGLLAVATCGLGALLSRFGRYARGTTRALALGLPIAGMWGLATHTAAPARAALSLGDRIDDLTRRELPSESVVFAADACTAFRRAGREAEEWLRPDTNLVPLALYTLPHAVDDWVRKRPELADSLRLWVLDTALDAGTLQSLSARVPTYIEPSDGLSEALMHTALDEGLFLRVIADGITLGDLRSERADQAVRLHRLYPLPAPLGAGAEEERHKLGRAHLLQALLRAALGDREGARDYLALSFASGYRDARQAALERVLARDEPLDIARFARPERSP